MHIAADSPILIVEDSDEDFEAIERAFKKTAITNPVFRCLDGDDALDFLHQTNAYNEALDESLKVPRPAIILLDLNLPGTDGREVLEHIKADEYLRAIPVVVLTTSSNPKDIEICYQKGANSYLLKHVNLEKFNQAIQLLNDYWFKAVVLPGSI